MHTGSVPSKTVRAAIVELTGTARRHKSPERGRRSAGLGCRLSRPATLARLGNETSNFANASRRRRSYGGPMKQGRTREGATGRTIPTSNGSPGSSCTWRPTALRSRSFTAAASPTERCHLPRQNHPFSGLFGPFQPRARTIGRRHRLVGDRLLIEARRCPLGNGRRLLPIRLGMVFVGPETEPSCPPT